MSQLSEYLQLIPKGLKNSNSIVKGIYNNVQLKFGNLSEYEKREIIRRRIICNLCPLNHRNAKTSNEYFLLMNRHYITKRKDYHCSMCGCSIKIKTASLDSNCGLDEWNNNNQSNKKELKWQQIK